MQEQQWSFFPISAWSSWWVTERASSWGRTEWGLSKKGSSCFTWGKAYCQQCHLMSFANFI